MTAKQPLTPRCAALVGTYTSGKTTLLEALLFTAGATHRRGSVTQGNTVGDHAQEAREHQMSTEPNFASCEYLGEQWHFIDCPGSVELAQDSQTALMGADVAIIVAEPLPEHAIRLAPLFRLMNEYQIPHMLFINKMDKVTVRIGDLMQSLQAISSKPLVLRQVPIRDGDDVSGFVDLVSERAYRYQEGKRSELIKMPDSIKDREEEARQEMLESLADFDDSLLEQLLEDVVPDNDEIYGYLTKDLREDLIVPVFLGSAEHGNGVGRLLKALRHEVPEASQTAARQGIPSGEGFAATVVKTIHQAHTGKLSVARIWRGKLTDGMTIAGDRCSGIYDLMGGEHNKLSGAGAGSLVALGRLEDVATGDLLTPEGRKAGEPPEWPAPITPVYGMAVTPQNRQDEVKLTASLGKLIEEDGSLSLDHNADTNQLLLWGQGQIHLKLASERLKNRYNVAVELSPPETAYKETIRRGVKQHARFKRQSGGHGQFGDVHIEVQPLPRGTGFEFTDSVVGGAIPKQYIPSVETGAREYLVRGPLGFPVVDVSVRLFDGQFHAVDSSDMAFKTAGRMAMAEALPQCSPVLLEPIYQVSVTVPSDFTAKIHGLVSGRRGQILGFESVPEWEGWDQLKCFLPQAELHDLIVELRSLTIGVGTFVWQFDHLQELTGRLAEKVIEARQEAEASH